MDPLLAICELSRRIPYSPFNGQDPHHLRSLSNSKIETAVELPTTFPIIESIHKQCSIARVDLAGCSPIS